jgi:acyl carrier protein
MAETAEIAMSVRETIIGRITEIAAQQRKRLAPLSDDLLLVDSGLDSLCLAMLVASLDDSLDLDPFSANDTLAFPATLGAFIELYENAAA